MSKYDIGDKIVIQVSVITRWNRFLYWLLRKPFPTKSVTFNVVEIYDGSNVHILPALISENEE